MSKLEEKVQRILNNEFSDDESSDDESSVDIKELNERLDEEMIKQMQEDFDEEDKQDKEVKNNKEGEEEYCYCEDSCSVNKQLQQEKHLSFETDLLSELNAINNNSSNSPIRQSATQDDSYEIVIQDTNNLYVVNEQTSSKEDYNLITSRLTILFNNIIITVYNFCKNKNKDLNWNEIIREFIDYHKNIENKSLNDIFNNDIDTCLSKMEMTENQYEEIKQQAFDMFVSEKCANVDEDDFDGPDDLDAQEWETIDNIICCYYYYAYYHK